MWAAKYSVIVENITHFYFWNMNTFNLVQIYFANRRLASWKEAPNNTLKKIFRYEFCHHTETILSPDNVH